VNVYMKSQFGTTGVADRSARMRIVSAQVSLGHLTETPEGNLRPAGDEQLR
jgi:hypothetical protein